MPKSKHWAGVKRGGGREEKKDDDARDDNESMRRREGRRGRWENKLTSHHSPKCNVSWHFRAISIHNQQPQLCQTLHQERGALEHPLSGMAFSLSFRFISFYLWQDKQTNNFSPWAMMKFENVLSYQDDVQRRKKPLVNKRENDYVQVECAQCGNYWNVQISEITSFSSGSALAGVNWTF